MSEKKIHPTAVVSPEAEIADDVTIGPFVVIEPDVVIGEGCFIESHTVIKRFTVLGKRNKIAEHVVLGGLPKDANFKGERSYLRIGDDNILREHVTIYRAIGEEQKTEIGSRNFMMVGVHISHNCNVGDDNVFVNGATLAEYVTAEDHIFFSQNTAGHQFVRFGRYAMIGGKSKIEQDVLPFSMTDGNPPLVHGLNVVGLRRAGFTSEERLNLKRAFGVLLRSGLSPEEAIYEVEKIEDENVAHLLNFIRNSKPGFVGAQAGRTSDEQTEQEDVRI